MEESLQELLLSLFGGDAALFSSIWDIIQGVILLGGGVIAMIYRHRDTVSRAIVKLKNEEVESLGKKLNTLQSSNSKELSQVKDVVTYMADIIVTLSLASPVLLDKAKQQIIGYAHEIKNINGVELEPLTEELIEALKEEPTSQTTLQEEKEVIAEEVKELKEEVKATEETVEDIINSIPL
jgi:flagellar motor protein MotB